MKKMRRSVLSMALAILMTVSVFASSSEPPGTEVPPEDLWDGVWDRQSDGGPETPAEEWHVSSDEEGENNRISVTRADGQRASGVLDRPENAVVWAASFDENDKALDILQVNNNQVTVSRDAQMVKLFALGEDMVPLGDSYDVTFNAADEVNAMEVDAPEGTEPIDDTEMSADAIGSYVYSGQRYNILSAINTGYAMDLSGNNSYNGSNIQLYRSNWTWAQDFKIQYVKYQNGKNWYKIVHTQSGKVLDVNASNWNSNGGNNVILYQYHGGSNQLWSFQRSGSGYRIQSMYNTRFYLDASGGIAANYTNIWVYPLNYTRAQLWYLDNVKDYQIRFVDGNEFPISRYYMSTGSSGSVRIQFRGTNVGGINADTSRTALRYRLRSFSNVQWPSSAGNTGYVTLNLYRNRGDYSTGYVNLQLVDNYNRCKATASLYLS